MLRLAVVAFLAIVYSYLQKEVGMPKTRISMRKIREDTTRTQQGHNKGAGVM